MAINKKLIHFKSKSVFNQKLANNELLDTSIVFIKDTQEIWTHGQIYKCSDPDLSNYLTPEDLETINSQISTLQTGKLDTSVAESTYAKKSEIPTVPTKVSAFTNDVGYLVEDDLSDYATTASVSSLQTSVNNALSNKLDKSTAETTYAKKTEIPDVSNFVTETEANSAYADKTEFNTLSESVANINTTLGTKADKSSLDSYVLKTSLSSYVPTSRTINGKALTGNVSLSASDVGAASTSSFDTLQGTVNTLSTTIGEKLDSETAEETYATKDELSTGLATKQATLVSGTNIKTIEGKSILGSGDIQITAANVGAYTTAQVDEKVTTINSSISSVSTQATTNKNAIATLNGAETTSGSVKSTAKSYATTAESNANDYTDEVKTALQNQITSNDNDIIAINNKFSNYATTANLNAVSTRVSDLEGLIETDSDEVIDKWNEVVTFLDGIGTDNDLEALLAAKANSSEVNALQTQVNDLTTANVAESGNLYFTNARARSAITGGASTIASSNLTASRALVSNGNGKVAVSAVTSTELGYLDGVTSAIQTQLDAKATTTALNTTNSNVSGLTTRVGTLEGYFTSGKAKTAASADSATTATNLASAPTLAAGTTDTNKITVTAGGKKSSEFTVPYATSAGSASTATSAGTANEASKTTNALTLKIKSGTTEGTNLYTFNGSAAKTLDIKAGSNISLTAGSGTLTISSTNTNTTYSFADGTNSFQVTPSGGSAQTVNITPSIQLSKGTDESTTTAGTLVTAIAASGTTAHTITSTKFTGTVGGSTTPIYLKAGVPTALGYTIAKSVPSNAVFTDTNTKVTSVANHYTPAEDVNAAISAASGTATNITGTTGKLNVVTGLKRDAAGHIVGVTSANIYSTDNNTTYSLVGVKDSTGLVKNGSTVTSTSGLTACPIINGIPYYQDTNTTYTLSSLGIGNVKNYDQSKAIKAITRSGTTFTYTCLDGTTGTFTQQDNNTTYSAATTSANGLMTADMVTKLNGIASGATAVSSSTVSEWGFTKNAGTVTGVKINGTTKSPSSGVVDLGTVITAHQSLSGKQDVISDLATIRSNATNGNTAYGWGNHASAGYITSSGSITGSAGSTTILGWSSLAKDLNTISNQHGWYNSGSGFTNYPTTSSSTNAGTIVSFNNNSATLQFAGGYKTTHHLYFRKSYAGTWESWRTILDSTNYTTYTANGDKAWASYGTATSVASVPVDYKLVKCTISASGSFTLASTPAAGREVHILVYNSSSADVVVSLPTASPYVNFSGDSLTVPATGYAEINVISDGSTMFIRHAA